MRVHLVGHSMGSLTARHFQYLLSLNTFTHNTFNEIKNPTPDFVISISSFAGPHNGSLAPQNHGGNWDKKSRSIKFNHYSKFVTAFKLEIVGQNWRKSENTENHVIHKKISKT